MFFAIIFLNFHFSKTIAQNSGFFFFSTRFFVEICIFSAILWIIDFSAVLWRNSHFLQSFDGIRIFSGSFDRIYVFSRSLSKFVFFMRLFDVIHTLYCGLLMKSAFSSAHLPKFAFPPQPFDEILFLSVALWLNAILPFFYTKFAFFCDLLSKFVFVPQSFLGICILFLDFLTKFAFFQGPFDKISFFLWPLEVNTFIANFLRNLRVFWILWQNTCLFTILCRNSLFYAILYWNYHFL